MEPLTTPSNRSQRRKFIKQLFAGSVVSLSLPTWATATHTSSSESFASLLRQYDANGEPYWEMVKKQFTVPDSRIMMNAANLCPSPYFVSEKVVASLQKLEKDVSFQYRSVFETERHEALTKLAEFVGASPDEIGITRNTTESNNILVNGLDLKKGDEVLLWDQNHPSNGTAWEHRAKRYGFTVKMVAVPSSPATVDDLITPFAKAITAKTKLLSFSHISNTSGIAMPVKALCALAKEKNILSFVDGAQAFGMMDLNLKETGCDFYTGSMHKWLMGPLENGILYIKKEALPRIWPTIVGAGWKDDNSTVDKKLCVLGQRNETTASAITSILDFHTTIGKQQVEARVKALNTYLKEQVKKKIPTATFVTPVSPSLSGGVTITSIPSMESRVTFQKLYESYGIACAPTGGLRFSPHIYNTMADIDRVVEALTALV